MKKWFLGLIAGFFIVASYANPLPANDVFQIQVNRFDPNNFVINWQIKPGYFLYTDRIKITSPANSTAHIGQIRFPASLRKTDHQGHEYRIYRNQLNLPVAVLGEKKGETTLELHYQGCADDGFCYPPETKKIRLIIDENLALSAITLLPEISDDKQLKQAPSKQLDQVSLVFTNHHWSMILLSFFGFGLLLSFTPCVLPMVPVLSGIIVGHGSTLSTRKAFFLSLSYVLSMAITYALAGALVALLGSNLQLLMQSPWIIGLFSALFVILAISMFGYFELKLPVSWQIKLAKINRRQGSGHYIGAAIMGALSTLILSPCVTAPLIGALGYIAQTGNALLGGFSLFFLGMGMGTPLLLIGTSAGRWLPKAGHWMNVVKAFFGVLLLAVAIHLLSRILPPPFPMLLWAILLIYTGVFSGAFVPSETGREKFHQATGILLLGYGLLILVGASTGSSNPLQPLKHRLMTASSNFSEPEAKQKTIVTSDQLQEALELNKGRLILLDFYADWCSSCQVMETTTFEDPDVRQALKKFAFIKVDITANNHADKALLRQFNVIAPPTLLFFNPEGEEMPQWRLVGEVDSKELLPQLDKILASAK